MNEKFNKLPLKKELLDNLAELKFDSMTPIQAKSLPIVLDGKDIIAQAKTGSGKTAAFGLGILNSLDVSNTETQSFVMCPTRELAEQVAKELRTLARMISNVKILTLCGGTSEYHQERSLDYGAHIIVGTPGRLLRLLKKKSLTLNQVETLVLDEADRMLDMGFYEDIMSIVAYLPKQRQSLLFSATFPEEIQDLSNDILNDATSVKVDTEHTASSIDQIFYEIERHQDKEKALLKVLSKHRPERLIVFCKTKVICNSVADFLNDNNIYSASIHGDLEQNERTCVMTMFSNHSLSVLVATDVAARGLDIKELPAVVNFDLPNDPEIYTHRVGRTGRAGKAGLAFSFYVPQEGYKIDEIEQHSGEECKTEQIDDLELDESYSLNPPMKTMYISGGKKDKLRPGDILGALTGDAKLQSSDVGNIAIFNILCYVAIKEDRIDEAVNKLNSGRIKNKKFKVGIA